MQARIPQRKTLAKNGPVLWAQIIGIIKEHEAGVSLADLCRKHGVSDASIYKWKAKFGGMEVSEAKRLKTRSPIRNPFTSLISVCGVRISCHSGSERASIAAIKVLRCSASGRQHDILNLAPVSHLGHDLKFVRLAKPEDRAVIVAVRVRSVHNQERTGTH